MAIHRVKTTGWNKVNGIVPILNL